MDICAGTGSAVVQWTTARVPCPKPQGDGIAAARLGATEKRFGTGLTTIFVTHDQDEAMDLADLVVVMSMGRIEQVGRPIDIRSRPATSFVREFIAV